MVEGIAPEEAFADFFRQGRCYEKNDSPISAQRQQQFPVQTTPLSGPSNACQNDVKLPADLKEGQATLYWVCSVKFLCFLTRMAQMNILTLSSCRYGIGLLSLQLQAEVTGQRKSTQAVQTFRLRKPLRQANRLEAWRSAPRTRTWRFLTK